MKIKNNILIWKKPIKAPNFIVKINNQLLLQ